MCLFDFVTIFAVTSQNYHKKILILSTNLESKQIRDNDIRYRLEAGGISEDAETHSQDRQPARQPDT